MEPAHFLAPQGQPNGARTHGCMCATNLAPQSNRDDARTRGYMCAKVRLNLKRV